MYSNSTVRPAVKVITIMKVLVCYYYSRAKDRQSEREREREREEGGRERKCVSEGGGK